jgi:sulfane dehydrogenase subunit SoxC
LLDAVAESSDKLSGGERRRFLKQGLGAFAAVAASGLTAAETLPGNLPPDVPSWSRRLGAGVVTNPHGQPSQFESHVKRRTVDWLTADRIASISFTPLGDLDGIITPNGLVFERYHAGLPAIDPAQHRLMIHGMVQRPIILSMDDLMRFPSVSMIRFLECPANGGMEWRGAQMDRLQFTHGMLACCEWTGVLLSTLLEEVGLAEGAAWVLAGRDMRFWATATGRRKACRSLRTRRPGRRSRRMATRRCAGCRNGIAKRPREPSWSHPTKRLKIGSRSIREGCPSN